MNGAQSPDVSTIVESIGFNIDAKLRELSPQYKLKPKGYRLPLPRLGKRDQSTDVADSIPIEAREIIATNTVSVVFLPRTYPDHSLPWVLANDLLINGSSDQQIVPIVVDGATIRPPKLGLTSNLNFCLETAISQHNASPVFIIENFPFSSQTRLSFLTREMEQHPDAKFVFVERTGSDFIYASEFFSHFSASEFDIAEVSFTEIAHFVQKNFDLDGTEAEVIALKLRDTFDKFNLAAHPTFFAGIASDTLSTLLQANHRAELIQLAVGGFLTFLVASDTADVRLGRTTRERFLRSLVKQIRVEKKSFTQEELVQFTLEFAEEHDFEINPIEFISTFEEKGILHFSNGIVVISLPFLESYLLALELSMDEESASLHFKLDSQVGDPSTFDLYSEIGAAQSIIEDVHASLDASIQALKHFENDQEHILLTDEIRPKSIQNLNKINSLKKTLARASEDVRADRHDKSKKQSMLDFSTRVRKSLSDIADQQEMEGLSEGDKDLEAIATAFNTWLFGTILLGSGAEHLDAKTKRKLSAQVIELASLLMETWLQERKNIDFEEAKKDLAAPDSLHEFISAADMDENISEEEARKIVYGLVDILEFAILTDPFRQLMSVLCDHAQNKVLATSVREVETLKKMEEIIKHIWLADLDYHKNQNEIRRSFKNLPFAPLLLVNISLHFMTRVFWNHWRKKDRLALLDVAQDLLNPLNISVGKSELIRTIKKAD